MSNIDEGAENIIRQQIAKQDQGLEKVLKSPISYTPVDPNSGAKMKKLKDLFVNKLDKLAKNTAQNLIREAAFDPAVHKALNTHTVVKEDVHGASYGVAVGTHAIFPVKNDAGKTRYDVANVTTGQPVAKSIYLYESADAMVKLLNKGYSFYSPEVRDVLMGEETYVKHYNDALTYKRQAQGSKDLINESRFESSLEKAQQAKKIIVKLNESIK
jgi:hypothetical protein